MKKRAAVHTVRRTELRRRELASDRHGVSGRGQPEAAEEAYRQSLAIECSSAMSPAGAHTQSTGLLYNDVLDRPKKP